MPRLNKTTLIGHLGAQPEVVTMQNGGKVATFSVATDDSYRDQQSGNRVERADWHRCVVYAPRIVESIEKLMANGDLKGSQVYVEGKLRTRTWEKDGDKRYSTEIIVNDFSGFQLLGKRNNNGDAKPAASNEANGQAAPAPQPAAAAA